MKLVKHPIIPVWFVNVLLENVVEPIVDIKGQIELGRGNGQELVVGPNQFIAHAGCIKC